jgi:hypothetical protein
MTVVGVKNIVGAAIHRVRGISKEMPPRSSPKRGGDILGWLAIGKSERGRKSVERRKRHEKCLDAASIFHLL